MAFLLLLFLFPMLLKQIMDRARSYETGIFKKPSDFLQMFKVLSLVSPVRHSCYFLNIFLSSYKIRTSIISCIAPIHPGHC
jgi:hypothetical protein